MPAVPVTADDGQWNQPITGADVGYGLSTTGRSATTNDGWSVNAITADDVAATNAAVADDGRVTHDATTYGSANDAAIVLRIQDTLQKDRVIPEEIDKFKSSQI